MSTDLSAKLFAEARKLIPGGVNSPVRAWRAVGGSPRFISRARGSQVIDADGNAYIDYVGSWGPMILGHAHPKVLTAIHDTMRDGTSFGAPTAREVELARVLSQAIPSIEMVRLVSSGTEAAMTAIRLARAFTGRVKLLKFNGCYHGHSDSLLVRAGSGALTFGVPDSPGVPEALASHTLIAEFNDAAGVNAYFAAEGKNIAAVVVEPIVGNMGVVPPEPGFLEGLRGVTRRYGALLIFDEVITGFRVAYGGVQTLRGITPDLTCLGKIVGGGLPLAAFGGRRDIMEQLAPVGPVYQAGTLSGNPLAVAAGVETLAQLRQGEPYTRLESLGARLEAGLREALARHRVRGVVNRVGSMWTLFFGVDAMRSGTDIKHVDTVTFGKFFQAMLDRGIYLPPSAFEAAFISLAHSEDDIDATIRAANDALAALG
ncbi:MAG TPA: glutamate-1-semialdehyde 2,1-aminomutase [Candidatus Kryptonia bacterium]|nr:glutamate-1-semialdehyde 2,1-aminomutase [Candidatus Kryptonia bacterium]